MTRNQKVLMATLFVSVLVAICGGYYFLQSNKQVEKSTSNQSQQASINQNQENSTPTSQSPVQSQAEKAVYSTCNESYTSILVYDTNNKNTEEVFTDKGKSYRIPCDNQSINHGTIKDNVLSFDAKDRNTSKDLKLSFDLSSKKEMVTPYDPYTQSSEEIKKIGSYNIITSTIKKSFDGKKILFATQNPKAAVDEMNDSLFLANTDYSNIKQIDNFPGVKCINNGNAWDAYDNSYGWIANDKIFIDDTGFECSGNGSFLLDSSGGNPVKIDGEIVVVPQPAVLSDNDFWAVVTPGMEEGNHIVLLNVDTGKIVKEIGIGWQVSISSDGKKMFYELHPSQDLNIPGNLYVADINGNNYEKISATSAGPIYVIGWVK